MCLFTSKYTTIIEKGKKNPMSKSCSQISSAGKALSKTNLFLKMRQLMVSVMPLNCESRVLDSTPSIPCLPQKVTKRDRDLWACNLEFSIFFSETATLPRNRTDLLATLFWFRQRFMTRFWNVRTHLDDGIEDPQNARSFHFQREF